MDILFCGEWESTILLISPEFILGNGYVVDGLMTESVVTAGFDVSDPVGIQDCHISIIEQ